MDIATDCMDLYIYPESVVLGSRWHCNHHWHTVRSLKLKIFMKLLEHWRSLFHRPAPSFFFYLLNAYKRN